MPWRIYLVDFKRKIWTWTGIRTLDLLWKIFSCYLLKYILQNLISSLFIYFHETDIIFIFSNIYKISVYEIYICNISIWHKVSSNQIQLNGIHYQQSLKTYIQPINERVETRWRRREWDEYVTRKDAERLVKNLKVQYSSQDDRKEDGAT